MFVIVEGVIGCIDYLWNGGGGPLILVAEMTKASSTSCYSAAWPTATSLVYPNSLRPAIRTC